MKKIYIYLLIASIVAIYACQEEGPKEIVLNENQGLTVNVRHSAGDQWSSTDQFLPLPFNVAKAGNNDILILGKRIKRGEKLNVNPIGAIRIVQNDTLNTYILSIPTKAKYQSLQASDFDEFSTVHSGAKWIIEQYLLNRRQTFSTKLKSWENENFAIKYLIK